MNKIKYVNAIDTTLCGIGAAADGKHHYSIKCKDFSEAFDVQMLLLSRSHFKYVTITDKPRHISDSDYLEVVNAMVVNSIT